jgi:hypothetical protein
MQTSGFSYAGLWLGRTEGVHSEARQRWCACGGYWAKVKAGRKAKQTLFVEITDRALDSIQIHGG